MSIVTGFKTEIDGQIYDLGELFLPKTSGSLIPTNMKAIGGQDIGNLFQAYSNPILIPSFNTIYTVNITGTYYNLSQIFRPLNIINVISGTPPQIINTSGTTYSLLFTTVGTTIFTFIVLPISNITGYIIGAGGGGSSGTGFFAGNGGGGGGTQIIDISSITQLSNITIQIGQGGLANNINQALSTELTIDSPNYTAIGYGGYGGHLNSSGNVGGAGGGNNTGGTGGIGGTTTSTSGIIGLSYGGGGGGCGGGSAAYGGGGGGVAYKFNTANILLTGGNGGIVAANHNASYNGGSGGYTTLFPGFDGVYGGGGGGGGGGIHGGVGGNGCAIFTFTLL